MNTVNNAIADGLALPSIAIASSLPEAIANEKYLGLSSKTQHQD
ncbi:hypothetical protein [Nostoc sp.]